MSIELTEQQQRAMFSDDFNADDAFQTQIESTAGAGWNDPLMDVYDELDPRRDNHETVQ